MKKIIFFLLTLCLCSPNMTAETLTDTCGANVTWSLDTESGALTISGTGAMADYGYGDAPWDSNRSLIKTATIGSGVTTIGSNAFDGCSGLTSVTIPNGVTSIGDYAFQYCSSLTSVTLPDGVTNIGYAAFRYCTGLTSITIPDGVTSIGGEAFYGCSGLTSVTLPDGVTNIGVEAFWECYGLTEYIVSEGNARYAAIDGVLFNKDRDTLIAYPNAKAATYVIPDGVTSIGGYAFEGCTGLTSITIPNSVTNIEERAFEFTGLTGITIPNSVTVIGEEAFEYCTGLTSVIIGNSVTNIGEEAFHHCEGLANVIIGSSVTNIEYMAFADCVGLTEIHSKNPTPPSTGEDVFGGEYEVDKTTCKLYVPVGAKAAYQAAEEWKEFKNIIEEETGVSPVAASSVRAYVSGGGITIETGRPVKVSVYTVSGQKVYQSLLVGTAEIRLNSGVYIVKADNVSQKVVVK